jgi:hypothetical protein
MPFISESLPYLDNLATGLAGGTVASLIARLKTKRREGESDEEYRARVRNNVSTGLFGGAAVGASLPELYNLGQRFLPQEEGAVSSGIKKTIGGIAHAATTAPGLGFVSGTAAHNLMGNKWREGKLKGVVEQLDNKATQLTQLLAAQAQPGTQAQSIQDQIDKVTRQTKSLEAQKMDLQKKIPVFGARGQKWHAGSATRGGLPGLVIGTILNEALE